MKKTILLISVIAFLFTTCALEIANVIGPGGGYVFFDKGNYEFGWRYLECSPYDLGEIKDIDPPSIKAAMEACVDHSAAWYRYPWELPEEANMKKMLECFSYGLTRFSPDYYYLAVNKLPGYDPDNPYDMTKLEVVILHKSFDNKANGEVVKVASFPDVAKIRPIRRF